MIDVVVAVIQRPDGCVLVSLRQEHQDMAGLCEFPGGKQEVDESPEQALVRELQEEVGIVPIQYEFLMQIPWHYAHKSVCLHVFHVSDWQGEPRGAEGQALNWLAVGDLNPDKFPDANVAIIEFLHAHH